jgi:spore germination protein GerM
VPSDVQVRSTELGDDGVLDLDLTNLGKVESALQRLAVAQIVFTLTQLVDPGIDAVRFSVDGTEVAVPIENGVAPAGTPVTRDDEPSFVGRPTTTR